MIRNNGIFFGMIGSPGQLKEEFDILDCPIDPNICALPQLPDLGL